MALLTPTQPAFLSAAISLNCSPPSPFVRAASVTMRALPVAAARSRINSVTAGVSMTGFVSGGQHSVVMPPLAAANDSLAMVVLYSCPGSRSRAHRSISPGQTICSLASISMSTLKPSGACPSAVISPAATYTSCILSMLLAGSMSRPPLMRILCCLSSAVMRLFHRCFFA